MTTMETAPSASATLLRDASLPPVPHGDAAGVEAKDARELSLVFMERLAALEEGTREYQYVRNTLIEMNVSLVKFAAGRFRNRGTGEMEDIVQVGIIGLIKAIDRFDLARGVTFTTFALPYIRGEIMRHFRDTSWDVHVPRRLQELRVDLAKARDHLAAELGHEPTTAELAAYLKVSEDEVREGLVAAAGYTACSLDAPHNDDETPATLNDGRSYADRIGIRDHAMDLVEDLHSLAPLLAQLDERARTILELRFGQEMTQAQIGTELGLSQMHVSRILSSTLTNLRNGLL
ncbi:SigB/SigF/SigG family RNA polymerase sigma factor, partial [Streptomyces sp. NPDC127084]|uniref:SigB/SigF/SigG family RNA polymerase sigma factor n=1 Tax=Streptomyces sp. NPDC127084 TaxID=3347133 RepID=UPI00364A2F6C